MADDDLDDLFGDFLEADEGGGESTDPSAPRSGKRALIFVCDANSAMLRHDRIVEDDYGEMPLEPNSSPLERAMKIAFLSCKWRLMTSPNDLIGVVLYNTGKTKNEHGFDNISVMQPLSGITVNFMKELRSFQSNPKAALDEFGGPKDPKGGDTALDQALWLCSFLFSGANLKSFDEQMVWLFTNNDNPHNGDTALRTKLVKRFEDCFQANQGINVWPLVPRTQFNESRFFESALEPGKQTRSDADEEGEECEFLKAGVVYDVREDGGSYHDNDLEKLVNRRNFAKRRTVPLTLDLGNNLSLGLDFFAPIMPASLPLPQQLDGKELHVVKRQTTHVCQDSLNELTPDQISHFFEFGDSRVFVRREEVKQLRNFGKPKTLKALGFKPSSSIKPWYALRSPYFAIPSEKELEGSTMAFIALLNTMIEKDVVLYVAGTLRANEVVKLMALIPRPEKVKTIEGEAFIQELPGFDVIVLPWANDIRKLKLEPKPVVSEQPSAEHIDKAKAMINHFNLLEDEESGRYHPVQNPHLARHFQALEYVAMRNTGYGDASIESDDEYDETRPLEVSDAQRQAIGDFAALCPPESMEESMLAQKRKTADSKAAPAKRVKKEPAVKPDPSEWRTLAAENKLSKLTVAQLKAICKEAGVAISGNKTALVERIEEVAAGSEADESSDQDVVMASPPGESDQGDDSDNDDGKGGERTKVKAKPSKGRNTLPSRATRRRGTQSSRARIVDTDSSDDEAHLVASHSSHSEAEADQEFGEGPGRVTKVPKKKPLGARPSRRAAAIAQHASDNSDEDATQKRATGLTGASGSDSEIELYSD